MKYRCDMQKLRQLIKLANDYYPERLGIALVINANMLFWGLWKLMSPWMDKTTSEKSGFFRRTTCLSWRSMLDLSMLPKTLEAQRKVIGHCSVRPTNMNFASYV